MRASEVFLKAGTVLKERGHAKNEMEDEKGAVCLAGAIACASTGSPHRWDWDNHSGWVNAVAHLIDEPSAICWNNRPERKPAEVIAALDAAAVVALQEEGLEPEDVL